MALKTKEYTLDAAAVEAVSAELQAYLKDRRVEAPAADPAGRVAGQNLGCIDRGTLVKEEAAAAQ